MAGVNDVYMEHFVSLFMAISAIRSDSSSDGVKSIYIPIDIKPVIKEALSYENYHQYFSEIINMDVYLENPQAWIDKFEETLNLYFKNSNRAINVNSDTDKIELYYTQNEIDEVVSKYNDSTLKSMDVFVKLFSIADFLKTESKPEVTNPLSIVKKFIKSFSKQR